MRVTVGYNDIANNQETLTLIILIFELSIVTNNKCSYILILDYTRNNKLIVHYDRVYWWTCYRG